MIAVPFTGTVGGLSLVTDAIALFRIDAAAALGLGAVAYVPTAAVPGAFGPGDR